MRTIILIGAQAEILRETEQSGMLTTEQSCIQLLPLLFSLVHVARPYFSAWHLSIRNKRLRAVWRNRVWLRETKLLSIYYPPSPLICLNFLVVLIKYAN